jgi:hypothetical protein
MNFYTWAIHHGYNRGLKLERNDNDGNYEPGNCRWATQAEQMQNTSLTKLNPESVLRIYHDARSHSAIARDHDIAESSVSRIKSGKTWENITNHNNKHKQRKTIYVDPIIRTP